jgi:dTDP-4-amino-4,6-dideoxygalactose transaminase
VERDVAKLLDDPPAVLLTGSCTHALEAAALLSGVGPRDEVVVPAFTFPSTAAAFLLRGATVRFADIRPHDGNVDPLSIADRLTERTRVVVVVHYAGVGAEMDPIRDLAASSGAVVVEDAAHGVHARYAGRPLGRFGTFGCLSFHRTKNVTAGDGGALVVNDPGMCEAARIAIDKGTNRAAFDAGVVRAYEWSGLGSAWHLPDAAVPLLASSLADTERIQERRHRIWNRYAAELADWASERSATLPSVPERVEHPAHLFWITLPPGSDRDVFVQHCASRGVEVARHFSSLPSTPYGRSVAADGDRCPVADRFAAQLVRLPLHHLLSDDEVTRVIDAVTSSPS